MFLPYRRPYWYRPPYAYGYVAPAVQNTSVTNNLSVNANATGGSTVAINVNQSTVVNNTSTGSGGYFPYYRRWW